ncbi:galactose oxidase [Pluteus cervinus]|uniref:Galactose oxidase n=1 Tax=Pluteus cervinus TaxID=181527 RepID=A0ACD3A853_9AGAR|nr:galactose oxidase [Pluteus cervinus]
MSWSRLLDSDDEFELAEESALPTIHSHTVTLVGQTIWIIGGNDDNDFSTRIYCFDTETLEWTTPDVTGDVPPPLRGHTATLVGRHIVLFGGGHGLKYYNTIYILDTKSRHWSKPSISGPLPVPRRTHSALLYKDRIWIFGGGSGVSALRDLWALDFGDLSHPQWQEIRTFGKRPSIRGFHTVNLVGSNKMVILGGTDGQRCFGDCWVLDLDSLIWQRISSGLRLFAHTSTHIGPRLYIFGGHDGTEYSCNISVFNLDLLQYEEATVIGEPPSPRGHHASVHVGDRLFVLGGYDGTRSYPDIYTLDLVAGAYVR